MKEHSDTNLELSVNNIFENREKSHKKNNLSTEWGVAQAYHKTKWRDVQAAPALAYFSGKVVK